ncbi:hypothetical protein ACFQ34_30430 [Pseudonocardia benzenivorans]|uniref:Uncharacterized protein n=2 Tax=Pseudonocardia TaxID=1847 RepID=F4CUI7_PSEUX|nr:hypothetical protein [Pseudonocardia dioxanivorans]AEA25377.1 hypothetical protein Psed_3181 [Pseudonocardia dioxanivorans CB1190]GJF02343.1 hypothetical protein PSD17_13060 [Pseudonocardia sp. D17]
MSENLTAQRAVPTPAWRTAVRLATAYLVLSVAGVVAIVLLRNDPAAVTPAVWIRGVIVAASAVLTFAFARRAAAGSRRALLRLRLVTAIMVVAIVVVVAVPGAFPVWLKIEQVVCGVLLLGIAMIADVPGVRQTLDRRAG